MASSADKTTIEEDVAAIRSANEQFYRAVTSLDVDAMSAVWEHGQDSRCIHPGWEMIEGWELVRQSWEIIFNNTSSLVVEPSEVMVRVEGDMAWVCCLETITSTGETGSSLARATNLFARTPEGWKMILHHASQVPADEPTVH
jgi:ketosteroid isomerase-like protein